MRDGDTETGNNDKELRFAACDHVLQVEYDDLVSSQVSSERTSSSPAVSVDNRSRCAARRVFVSYQTLIFREYQQHTDTQKGGLVFLGVLNKLLSMQLLMLKFLD